MTSYQLNKKAILKYQKENPNYRVYKRKYEAEYSKKNRVSWNLKSWKSMRKARGIDVTPNMIINYLRKKEHRDKQRKVI